MLCLLWLFKIKETFEIEAPGTLTPLHTTWWISLSSPKINQFHLLVKSLWAIYFLTLPQCHYRSSCFLSPALLVYFLVSSLLQSIVSPNWPHLYEPILSHLSLLSYSVVELKSLWSLSHHNQTFLQDHLLSQQTLGIEFHSLLDNNPHSLFTITDHSSKIEFMNTRSTKNCVWNVHLEGFIALRINLKWVIWSTSRTAISCICLLPTTLSIGKENG